MIFITLVTCTCLNTIFNTKTCVSEQCNFSAKYVYFAAQTLNAQNFKTSEVTFPSCCVPYFCNNSTTFSDALYMSHCIVTNKKISLNAPSQ